MLFTSWRNEDTDLLDNFSFYQERFLNVKDSIDEQMKLYAVCSENLDKIQGHLNGIDADNDNFDPIAPFTQNIEYQDEAEGLQDLHRDLNESYDLSEDVEIPSAVQSSEPLILNELQDQEYRQLVQTLNQKQKEFFFYHILHLVKTTDKPFYYFLSGGAGVGKSHLISSIGVGGFGTFTSSCPKNCFSIFSFQSKISNIPQPYTIVWCHLIVSNVILL